MFISDRTLILDGANGTELQRRGMPPGCCSEKWILEHPEAERDIQRRYIEAGSTAILAPTFGANRIALGRHGLGDRVRDYNTELVKLSRELAGSDILVGGDLSPTGLACGSIEPALFDSLKEVFTEQARALEDAGVDFFMVETQISLAEAKASVLAVKEVSDKPVFVSFTLAPGGKTFSGGDVASALLTLEPLGIAGFGINCVDSATLIEATISRLRGLTSLPLLVQANAGLPETVDGRAVYSMTPEAMAADALRYYECGADIFGSCCGSCDAHIRAIADAVGGLPLRRHKKNHYEYLCTEYLVLRTDEIPNPASLTINEHWEEEMEKLEQDGVNLCRIRVENREQLQILLNQQGYFRMPLSVHFCEKEIEDEFRAYYIGIARIE